MENGISFTREDEKIVCAGKLKTNSFTVRGDLSSQFVTGLLFALPFLGGGSVTVLPPIESRPYLHLTVSLLAQMGIRIETDGEIVFRCPPNAAYHAGIYTVEGDESSAAVFHALRILGDDIKVSGCNPETKQGDACAMLMLEALANGSPTLDLSHCPDLAPLLFAASAARHGGTFTGVKRLRFKESDRIEAMKTELKKCGAQMKVTENRVTVTPPENGLRPMHPFDSHKDHRVAMALSVLLTRTGGTLDNAEAVHKSYPDFFDALRSLGYAVQILA